MRKGKDIDRLRQLAELFSRPDRKMKKLGNRVGFIVLGATKKYDIQLQDKIFN